MDTEFRDLYRMSAEELDEESSRLGEIIANWTDADGDQRRYNSTIARASEANRLIAQREVAMRNFARGVGIEAAFGPGFAGFGGSLINRSDPLFDLPPSDVLRLRPDEARSKALRAVETRGRHLAGSQADQMDSVSHPPGWSPGPPANTG